MRYFLDTDIIFDFLFKGEDSEAEKKLLMLSYFNEVQLFASTAQANDLLYVLSRKHDNGMSKKCKHIMLELSEIITFIPLSNDCFINAIESEWNNLEKACIWQAAKSINADAIISRSVDEYATSSIPAMTASGWLKKLKEKGISYSLLNFENDTSINLI